MTADFARALRELSRAPRCARCAKPEPVCVCDRLLAEPLASRLRVLILQHPQEQDVVLGTAPLLARALASCQVVPGLSWPSLERVAHTATADRSRWAVLFAGTKEAAALRSAEPGALVYVDRQDRIVTASSRTLAGLVVLDGTWSQAKTLWWRNPWLLKLTRIALRPREPSMYGRLRSEPRAECVSTLEAVADTLVGLGEPAELQTVLRRLLRTLLQRVREQVERPRS